MKISRVAGLSFRLGIVAAVLVAAWLYRASLADVLAALHTAGWISVIAMSAWHLIPFALCALAESVLMAGVGLPAFLMTRWVHEAVSELAGFIPLSGEVAAGRVLTQQGVAPTRAAGLTVVDLTCEAMAEFTFILVGVALWLLRHPAGAVVHWALAGAAIALPLLLAMLFVQRSPLVRFIETLPARLMPKSQAAPDEQAGTLAAIEAIYAHRGRVALGSALHLAAWLLAAGEAALALAFLGHPLAVTDVVAMEAFIMPLRAIAIFVPAGLGVQEGAYVVIGGVLGLPPEVALAVSLLKRGREILWGGPGLIAWQAIESRRRKVPAE
jgi:putative membrane protein